MFTGIIQNQGIVIKREERNKQVHFTFRLSVKEKRNLLAGESIAVNGVCLTACGVSSRGFEADVIRETLESTTLKDLQRGEKVNLERSLRYGDPLGGHFVTGHVDGLGQIVRIKRTGKNKTYSIKAGKNLRPFLAPKGSITVDGISLTVQKVKGNLFEIGIVPHTLKVTALSNKKPGDAVNLEADLIARYLNIFSEFLPQSKKPGKALLARLKKQGF